jgi:hypothetical protein
VDRYKDIITSHHITSHHMEYYNNKEYRAIDCVENGISGVRDNPNRNLTLHCVTVE